MLHSKNVIKTLIGESGTNIGEYIFIGDDVPTFEIDNNRKNIIVGISIRDPNDNYDHVNLYRILHDLNGDP